MIYPFKSKSFYLFLQIGHTSQNVTVYQSIHYHYITELLGNQIKGKIVLKQNVA